MSGMRKSSRGNPYHDERGRFTTANGVRSVERNYDIRQEAIENGNYDKSDAKDLRSLAKRAVESDGGTQNNWSVQRGGYDLDYEAYYDGEAAFGVINGKVEPYQDKYNAYAEDFAAASGYPMSEEYQKERDQDRARQAREASTDEIVFLGMGKSRCHATIVNELPKKTSRFSNGYADIGDFEHNGKTYTIYKDRDSDGAYSYFATEKKEMTPKGAAGYLGEKDCVDNVVFYGANGVEFEIYGTKHEGYLHVKDGTPYFKPLNGKEYVTVDRYVSTKEYEMRYDYIMDRYECKEFTEITGSIGGDVERVRIYDDGNVYLK